MKTTSAGLKLGLLTSTITLLGGFAASAQLGLIVNETFDPPSLTLAGWEDPAKVINISRQYVTEGVLGSTAAQISAEFLDYGAYIGTTLYQNGLVTGSDRATPQNTTLSFDVKVDRPGLVDVSVGVQSWDGYIWSYFNPGLMTASVGRIPLGSYVPGTFKAISVPLGDPLWIQDPWTPSAGPFDPSGKTYQIWFGLDSGSLPDLGQFTVTIDNIRVSTKTPMVPWQASGTAQAFVELDESGQFVVTLMEAGVAAHLGEYTQTVIFSPFDPSSWINQGIVEITADNGDKLFGSLFLLPLNEIAVAIEDGTGRFEGAKASYLGTLTWTDVGFTATSEGSLSTVGSNK